MIEYQVNTQLPTLIQEEIDRLMRGDQNDQDEQKDQNGQNNNVCDNLKNALDTLRRFRN